MRTVFFCLATLALFNLQSVYADHTKEETVQYAQLKKGASERTLPLQRLPPLRRSASFTQVGALKSAFKDSAVHHHNARETATRQPEVKKRVRFFVHEDGDMNLIDNQGNDYVSTDEDSLDENDDAFGVPTTGAMPSPPVSRLSPPPPRSASWSATSRQRQERAAALEQQEQQDELVARQNAEDPYAFGTPRTVSSNTMMTKRRIDSAIRTTENKIEFLLEMIAEQKQERCEAAKYNLLRVKLIDFRQQSRMWNARIRLLKHELNRQEATLEYYEHERVMVQRRLENELRHSQRLPLLPY